MRAVSAEEAVAMIPNGARLMVGGFMGVGTPERLVDELVRQHKSELSLVCNDAAVPGKGVGKLIDAALVSTLTASHIGLNPKVQAQMLANKIAVDLVPQGTLVERIRAGGCGLGGVLTPMLASPASNLAIFGGKVIGSILPPVGISGAVAKRSPLVTPSARTCPDLAACSSEPVVLNMASRRPARRSLIAPAATPR